jgi:hypothetical protein
MPIGVFNGADIQQKQKLPPLPFLKLLYYCFYADGFIADSYVSM